jgi:hypothetical protein
MTRGNPPIFVGSCVLKDNGFCAWRFLYFWVLLRFRNTLGLMPSGDPPLGEPTHTGTSRTTKIDNYNPPHPHLSSSKVSVTKSKKPLKQGCKKGLNNILGSKH